MARYSKSITLARMKEIGVIPVFFSSDYELAKDVILACAAGGCSVVEFVNRSDRAVDVFSRLEEHFASVSQSSQSDIILGCGSIIDAPTAAMYISAGANFIVGPTLNEDTARLCNRRKIPYSPGCGTASEISNAHSLGVDICKIFPGASVGGPAFVKAVTGPMPWTEIMPTGGVSPDEANLRAWFASGVVCVGMGSKLLTKQLMDNRDFDGITQRVKETVELVKTIRGEI